jgi:hypothetical protein
MPGGSENPHGVQDVRPAVDPHVLVPRQPGLRGAPVMRVPQRGQPLQVRQTGAVPPPGVGGIGRPSGDGEPRPQLGEILVRHPDLESARWWQVHQSHSSSHVVASETYPPARPVPGC